MTVRLISSQAALLVIIVLLSACAGSTEAIPTETTASELAAQEIRIGQIMTATPASPPGSPENLTTLPGSTENLPTPFIGSTTERFQLSLNGVRFRDGQTVAKLERGLVFIYPAPGVDNAYGAGEIVNLAFYPNDQGDSITWGGVDSNTYRTASVTLDRPRETTLEISSSGPAIAAVPTPRSAPTASTQSQYSLIADASPASGGTVSGTGAYAPGTSATVVASPVPEYVLTGWSGSGACTGTVPTCSVTMDSNKTVTANFSRGYTLIATASPNTSGTVSGTGTYAANTSATVLAEGIGEYVLAGWSGSGACDGTINPCVVTIDANKTITANFSHKFKLETNADPLVGGTVTGDGSYLPGVEASARAFPNAGYGLASWTGECAADGALTNPCTVIMDSDKTVTANFAQPGFTLNTSHIPAAGGRVSAGGPYASGTTAGVTATPNPGYVLTSWTGNGACAGTVNPCSVTMDSDKTVMANFSQEFTLTTNVIPAVIGGTITAGGSRPSGAAVPVRATPSAGYTFTSWTGTGACAGTVNPCTVTMNADTTVTANFSRVFALTTSPNPSDGGSLAGAGSYVSGTDVQVTATPNSGYVLTGWGGSGACAGAALICTVEMGDNKTVIANFSQQFTLITSVLPEVGGSITPTLSASFASGTSTQVLATPNPGYVLTSWTGSGACPGAINPCSVIMDSEETLIAHFSEEFTLTADVSPGGSGSVTGGGGHPSGAQVEVGAIPAAGYGLSSWSGACASSGALNNPCTVTMDSDKTVIANFAQPGFSLNTSHNPTVGGGVTPGGTYASGTTAGVTATPNPGYVLTSWTGSGACAGAVNPCTVTMDADKTVIANFSGDLTLTTNVSPVGGGTVTPTNSSHPPGAQVEVGAIPAAGYGLSSWSGACASSGALNNPCTVTMDSDKTVIANFAQPGFSLNTSHNPTVGGGVTPGGTYASGTTAGVTATPNPGYVLTSWTGSGACAGAVNPCTVTMDADKTVIANFSLEVTLTTGINPGVGGSITPTPSASFASGTSTQVLATPNPGYVLTGWTGSGACPGAVNPCNVTMDVDKTVEANFSQEFTLNTSPNPSVGGSLAGAGTYTAGTITPVTVTPNPGYVFTSWTGDGPCAGTTNPCNVTIDADKTLIANFTQEFILTTDVVPGVGGSITPVTGSHLYGAAVPVTATPSLGYTLTGWTGSGACAGIVNPCTVAIDADKTVEANFSGDFNLITNGSPIGGGTVIPSTGSHPSGAQVQVLAIPNTAAGFYALESWSGACSGGALTNPCLVTMDSDKTVTANFSEPAVQLTTSIDPPGSGTVTPGGPYAPRTMAGVTAAPAPGYRLTSWTGSGACAGTALQCVVEMNADITVTANFSRTDFDLTTSHSPPAGGSVTPAPGGTYATGTDAQVTATPAAGYVLTSWTGSGACAGAVNPCAVTMDADKSITANFTEEFTLTTDIIPGVGGSITPTPSTSFPSGTNVQVTATSATGYVLTSWTGSGACTGTTNPCAVIMDADKAITANFTEEFTLTTDVNPGVGGSITPTGRHPSGTQVLVTASPSGDYGLASWSGACSGEGVANPCTVTMDSDKTVTANFALPSFTLTTSHNPAAGGSVTPTGTFALGTNAQVTATPAEGYMLTSWTGTGACAGITNPCTVNMDADKSITANFSVDPSSAFRSRALGVSVNANPPEGGTADLTVALPPMALVVLSLWDDCASSITSTTPCSGEVAAVARPGFRFTGWTGDCTGTGSCMFTIDQQRTVTANFAPLVGDASTELIVFVSNRDGNDEIYSMTAAGTEVRRLTSHSEVDSWPSLSPDGTKIAFARMDMGMGRDFDIYVMDSDGSNETHLASTLSQNQSESTDYQPSWSPDGSKIFFSTRRDGNYEIYSMNPDGSNQTRISRTPTIHEHLPSVSPDGTKILYYDSAVPNKIYDVDINGNNNRVLSADHGGDSHPRWNHDGTSIVFQAGRNDGKTIYTMDASGRNQTRVTASRNDAYFPTWSGDGTTIFFSAGTGGTQSGERISGGDFDIYAIASDGSGAVGMVTNSSDTVSNSQPSTRLVQPVSTFILNTGSSPALAGQVTPSGSFDPGEIVLVTASPNPGYVFASWTGDCSGGGLACTITMDGDKSVTANFDQAPPPPVVWTLNTVVEPADSGVISPVTQNHPGRTSVEVTQTPNAGYTFTGWSGDSCSGTGACDVFMDSNKSVTANFEKANGERKQVPPGFLMEIGSPGVGDGQLQFPRDVALASDGSIYVADSASQRIQKFDSNGDFIWKIGKPGDWLSSRGSGEGEFQFPWSVAVAPDDSFYVADDGNSRIQQFTPGGDFVREWGSLGNGDGEFNKPQAVAVAPDGSRVYVADRMNERIQYFTATGDFIGEWGTRGTGDGQFKWPVGVAVAPNGNVYVADSYGYRIQYFTATGDFIGKWGSSGTGDSEFMRAKGVTVASDGTVYVADSDNNRIQMFTAKGDFIGEWGSEGNDEGEFIKPEGVTVASDGSVYVADTENHRIQKFGAIEEPDISQVPLAFSGQIGALGLGNGKFQFPSDVALASDGSVYVADTSNHLIQKFTSGGALLSQLGTWSWAGGTGDGEFKVPQSVAVAPDDSVYVVDHLNSRIQYFTANGDFSGKWGSEGSGDGEFQAPMGIEVAPDGSVYVVERDNNRIQKFGPTGDFLRKWGSLGGDGQLQKPRGVAVAPDGNVYVVDMYGVQIYTSGGDFISRWGSNGTGDGEFIRPEGVTVASDGSIYVSDSENPRIQRFTSTGDFISEWGSQGNDDGEFMRPKGVTVASDGSVYVSDHANHRVQVFR